jgi:hypothetical protein
MPVLSSRSLGRSETNAQSKAESSARQILQGRQPLRDDSTAAGAVPELLVPWGLFHAGADMLIISDTMSAFGVGT